jgi:hypothetical protein
MVELLTRNLAAFSAAPTFSSVHTRLQRLAPMMAPLRSQGEGFGGAYGMVCHSRTARMILSQLPASTRACEHRPSTRIRSPFHQIGLSDLIPIGDWRHRDSRTSSVDSFGVV